MTFEEIYNKWINNEISDFEAHDLLLKRTYEISKNYPAIDDVKNWEKYLDSGRYKKDSSEIESCKFLLDRIEQSVCNNAAAEIYLNSHPKRTIKDFTRSIILTDEEFEEELKKFTDDKKHNSLDEEEVAKKIAEKDTEFGRTDKDMSPVMASSLFKELQKSYFQFIKFKEEKKSENLINYEKAHTEQSINNCIVFLKNLKESL